LIYRDHLQRVTEHQ